MSAQQIRSDPTQFGPETGEFFELGNEVRSAGETFEPGAVFPTPGAEGADFSNRLTHEDYRAMGDVAYSRAVMLEGLHGLDEGTVAEYRNASVNLINVTTTGPFNPETREVEADPVRLLMIARSLSKQAEAPEVAPYTDEKSRGIPRRENLQRLARETLERAAVTLMGEDSYAIVASGEMTTGSPADVVVAAAVEAAIDTDTAEYPIVPMDSEAITEELEATGKDGVVDFIEAHATLPGKQSLEFMSRMGELALEDLATDTHKIVLLT